MGLACQRRPFIPSGGTPEQSLLVGFYPALLAAIAGSCKTDESIGRCRPRQKMYGVPISETRHLERR